MSTSDLGVFSPNRPDALGVFSDSRISDDVSSPYNRSRYSAAVERIVERLLANVDVAKGEQARGKRREKTRPQDKSNTIRVYLKALECWSYYSVGQFGRELEPREMTSNIAVVFARWLAGEAPGPDVRSLYVKGMGPDISAVYDALARACSLYGQATIVQVVEGLDTNLRRKWVTFSPDAREKPDLNALHRILGKLIRAFRTIIRRPTTNEVRQEDGVIWGDRERDPMVYTYSLIPRQKLSTGSVCTHVAALSAVWGEMSKPATADEVPLAFNPWKSVYADWNRRLRLEKANIKAAGLEKVLTTPLIRAMQNACRGPAMEDRRDYFALLLLVGLGLRAEELAGLKRKDVVDRGGVWYINVLGKGAKVRSLLFESTIRDAWVLLNGRLEQDIKETVLDDEGKLVPTYGARYAAALLDQEAPLVPSLIRWGCNFRTASADPKPPEKSALEHLDTSGVRALIAKVMGVARVKEVASGVVRGLLDTERARIHPHAFRHYAATAMKQSGIDLDEIKEMLGHESLNTTSIYIVVPPQRSSAATAGVFNQLARRGPLSTEQLAMAKQKSINPLEEPGIIEAEPEEVITPAPLRATPLSPTQRQQIIASPSWAYQTPEAHIFYGGGSTSSEQSVRFKREAGEAQMAAAEASSKGDTKTYEAAMARLREANQKIRFWNQFQLGKLSRLPWFIGTHGRWKGIERPPIASFAQVSPENVADGSLIAELRDLYDQFWTERGPTACAAMIGWLGEFIDNVYVQFARVMIARNDAWIAFDAPSSPAAPVVREHEVRIFTEWLEKYGGSYKATMPKGSFNRGNLAIAAMDTLPAWMWVEDPLADPVYGISAEERTALKQWITGLQGSRPSRIRLEQWIDQMTVRLMRWALLSRTFQQRTGRSFVWAPTYSDRSEKKVADEALAIADEFDKKAPSLAGRIDAIAITASADGKASEEEIRKRVISVLTGAGIDTGNPAKMRFDPAIARRAGAQHIFDAALLTFDLRATIVHDDATRRIWFERYGTDSECVVRRALRALWERRRAVMSSKAQSILVRSWDVELSSAIPAPKAMEQRMRDSGWRVPETVDALVRSSQALWAGLADVMRQDVEGLSPQQTMPRPPVEEFWATEMPFMARFVESLSPAQQADVIPDEPVSVRRLAEQIWQAAQGPADESDVPEPPPPVRVEDLPTFEIDESEEIPFGIEGLPSTTDLTDVEDDTLDRRYVAATPEELAALAQATAAGRQELAQSLEVGVPTDQLREDQRKAIQDTPDMQAKYDSLVASLGPRGADPVYRAKNILWSDDRSTWYKLSDPDRRRSLQVAGIERGTQGAQTLSQYAKLEPMGWSLYLPALSMVTKGSQTYIVFALPDGMPAVFERSSIKSIVSGLERTENPQAFWDEATGQLEFRWGDKGRKKLQPVKRKLPRAGFVEVILPAQAQPNSVRWRDMAPNGSRWPGYPNIDQQDAAEEYIRTLEWPRNPTENLLQWAIYQDCMQQYASWKRRAFGATSDFTPNGWTAGAGSLDRGPMPHPVDVLFSTVHSA